MRRFLYILSFIIAAPFSLWAQDSLATSPVTCPTIHVECPLDDPSYTADFSFTAKATGVDPQARLTFNWTVSAGVIRRGQGTPTIIVGEFGNSITVRVEVQGLPPGCTTTHACSMTWCPIVSKPFDEYGNIEAEDEMARLDHFAIELSKNPGSLGYLIAYAGRRAYVNEAIARLERAKDYLVTSRRVNSDRIVTINGGYRDEIAVELYIVPVGAHAPAAAPTVEPDDVQIIADPPNRTKRRTRGR